MIPDVNPSSSSSPEPFESLDSTGHFPPHLPIPTLDKGQTCPVALEIKECTQEELQKLADRLGWCLTDQTWTYLLKALKGTEPTDTQLEDSLGNGLAVDTSIVRTTMVGEGVVLEQRMLSISSADKEGLYSVIDLHLTNGEHGDLPTLAVRIDKAAMILCGAHVARWSLLDEISSIFGAPSAPGEFNVREQSSIPLTDRCILKVSVYEPPIPTPEQEAALEKEVKQLDDLEDDLDEEEEFDTELDFDIGDISEVFERYKVAAIHFREPTRFEQTEILKTLIAGPFCS
jgi:hypothetical protein